MTVHPLPDSDLSRMQRLEAKLSVLRAELLVEAQMLEGFNADCGDEFIGRRLSRSARRLRELAARLPS